MTEPEPATVATPVVNQPTESTPEPVLKAAAVWGTVSAVVVTGVGLLVTFGVLSSEQAAILNDVVSYVTVNIVPVGTAIVGVTGLVSGLVASHATALVARRKVTPVAPAKVARVEDVRR